MACAPVSSSTCSSQLMGKVSTEIYVYEEHRLKSGSVKRLILIKHAKGLWTRSHSIKTAAVGLEVMFVYDVYDVYELGVFS